jgi:hypothetical protein
VGARAARIRKGQNRMDKKTFVEMIRNAAPQGTTFRNPSNKGTSKILSHSASDTSYQRGKSAIHIGYDALFDVLNTFTNKMVTSTDMREHNPSVFGAKGHPCNCTFLFLVFLAAGLVDSIEGEGKSGNPFRAIILPQPRRRQPDWVNPYLVYSPLSRPAVKVA